MRRRLAVEGAVLTALVITTVLVMASGADASPGTEQTVAGCQVVANPTSTDSTACPAADLAAADLKSFDLSDADLAGADLSKTDLVGATLTGADLVGATLTGADLRGASLTQAVLADANLTGADLAGDDLSGLGLSDTTLAGADLEGVDLSGQDLAGLDLADANLTGANLTEAVLSGVNWSHSVCPDGSPSSQVGDTCVNDLMVLEGAAIGATPSGTSSSLATTGQGSGSSGSSVPSAANEFSSLAFTGALIAPLASVGFALVMAGLLLILVADPAKLKRFHGARP